MAIQHSPSTGRRSIFRRLLVRFLLTGLVALIAWSAVLIDRGFRPENCCSALASVDLDHFSADYRQARSLFRARAMERQAALTMYLHPTSGPDGDPIFTDVAVLGNPQATKALFILSGTHGVEGFAGSGIQSGLLASDLAAQTGDDLKIVFVHAINPFGFAHRRRFNEDNIDLNRNFGSQSAPRPINHGYAALADALAPQSVSHWTDVTGLSSLLWTVATSGMEALRTAVTSGQYSHPTGLFYGGNSPAWSATTIKQILQKHAATAHDVIVIDIHTGLGQHGHGEIILSSSPSSEVYRRARSIWGSKVTSTISGDAVSAHLHGTMKLALPTYLPDATVTAVSLEFGTVPPLFALRALRDENWAHQHDAEPDQKNALKQALVNSFYPNTAEWNAAVWFQGLDAVQRAIGALKQPVHQDHHITKLNGTL